MHWFRTAHHVQTERIRYRYFCKLTSKLSNTATGRRWAMEIINASVAYLTGGTLTGTARHPEKALVRIRARDAFCTCNLHVHYAGHSKVRIVFAGKSKRAWQTYTVDAEYVKTARQVAPRLPSAHFPARQPHPKPQSFVFLQMKFVCGVHTRKSQSAKDWRKSD